MFKRGPTFYNRFLYVRKHTVLNTCSLHVIDLFIYLRGYILQFQLFSFYAKFHWVALTVCILCMSLAGKFPWCWFWAYNFSKFINPRWLLQLTYATLRQHIKRRSVTISVDKQEAERDLQFEYIILSKHYRTRQVSFVDL